MKILALETSGTTGSVALLQENGKTATLIADRQLPAGQRSAQSLLPTIQQLLIDQQWAPAELELIAVATGPGSFTGLRIGVTAAKTLAYATGAALAGANTLASLAQAAYHDRLQVRLWREKLWTVLDAQRQQLFVASFDSPEQLDEQAERATEVLAIEAWLERLQSGDAVCGPPVEKLKLSLPAGAVPLASETYQPQAAAVGQLGYQLFRAGQTVDPLQLVPQYHRLSAAEEKVS